MTAPEQVYQSIMRKEMRHVYESLDPRFYLRRNWCMENEECITAAVADDCGPAEYEWLYTEPEMNRPGHEDWIPLCEVCCVYWRQQSTAEGVKARPYRVRTLRGKVTP